MRDDRRRATRLSFTEEEQLLDVENAAPQTAQVPNRPKNPLASSRLRLTAEELGEAKLEKAALKVDRATHQLAKAKARLPKRRAMTIARETDIATGKAKFILSFEEKAKPPSKLMHDVLPSPMGAVHRQVGKAEDENVGVESAHGVEKSAESVYRTAKHSYRAQKLKPYRAAEKADRSLDRANIHLLQRQEQFASNPFSRWQQKRAIQKSYRASKAAGTAGSVARKGTSKVAGGVKNAFQKNKKTYVVGGLLFLMVAMIMNGLSACTPIIQTGMQAFVIGTW